MEVPATMITQHPDSASRYVPIQEEPEEAIEALSEGFQEVMVDFEGKMTPYHQTSQIVMGLLARGIVPGKDVFVTPRVTSPTKETVFRQLMALMSVVETNVQAYERGAKSAIVEIIVPMVETPEDILRTRNRVVDVIELGHKEFNLDADPNTIQPIPLVEEVPELLRIDDILGRYIRLSRESGFQTTRLRCMLGRSDPALSYGLVSAVLSNQVAISRCYELGEKYDLEIFPILGAGSLPFRGHVTLENLENLIRCYPGVRTVTLQSAIRYDHPPEKSRELAKALKRRLPDASPLRFDDEEYALWHDYIGIFTKHYLRTFLSLIDTVCRISDIIPKQRDRLARFSPVGYARDVARPEKLAEMVSDPGLREDLLGFVLDQRVSLPRAITFTAACYSIGLPPEFMGTGRGLAEIKRKYGQDGIERLLAVYPGLRADLAVSGRYLNKRVARKFLPEEAYEELLEDIEGIGEALGEHYADPEEDEFYHILLATARPIMKHILGHGRGIVPDSSKEAELLRSWLVEMGQIRGSLG